MSATAGLTLQEGAHILVARERFQGRNISVERNQPFPQHWQSRDVLAGLAENLGRPRTWKSVAIQAVVRQGGLVDAVTGEPLVPDAPAAQPGTRWGRRQRS